MAKNNPKKELFSSLNSQKKRNVALDRFLDSGSPAYNGIQLEIRKMRQMLRKL